MTQYFDKIAHRYDTWYQTKVGQYVDRTEKRLIFSMIKTKRGRALDLGCGTGNYTIELYKRGFDVIGVDLSQEMLRIAKAKIPNVLFIRADAYNLPFKKEVFDLVLSVTMFEFIYEPEKVLNEIHRVLKPGGEVVIGTMNGRSLWFLFKRFKSLFVETAYRYARFYTPKELETLLTNAGFDNVESRGIIFFPSFFPFIGIAEKVDQKFNKNLKSIGAFIAVRGVKK
ncbi:class I SAM-dependent methyltransferase [Thermococcus sp. M39]|nr:MULTISPECIES: class I SAM-dependent methyltransferase [unclassified Thermococcus]NJE08733.1 class I SAM-dependent methyltransferase [Thermococcus sp. M39]NJE12966.1 class I SAM-dependent methyltransferase [Thermococcus sp. LS2]